MVTTERTSIIKTTSARLTFDGSILEVKYLPVENINLEHAKVDLEAGMRLCNGRKVPVLVDGRNVKSIAREAREYYTKGKALDLIKAHAILVNSFTTRLIANFFIAFQKPPYPTKIFNDKASAREWLLKFT